MNNLAKYLCSIIIITGLYACNGGEAASTAAMNHSLAANKISNVANQCLNASALMLSSSSSVWYMSGSFKITNSCQTAQNISGASVTLVTSNVNDVWIPSAFSVNSFSPWLGASPAISASNNKNNLILVISNSYSLASNASIIVNFGYNRNNTQLTMPLNVSVGDITPVPTPSVIPTPTPTPTPTPSTTPTVVPTPTPSITPTPTNPPVTAECLNGSGVVIDQKSIWWMSGSFTITNTCSIAKNINGTSFIMKSSNSNDNLVASGLQLNSTTPYISGITLTTTTVAKAIQLTFNTSAVINPGAKLVVSFGYNPNGATLVGPFNVSNNNLPLVLNSTLNLTINSIDIASICNTTKPCNIKIDVANAEGNYNQTVATISTKAEIVSNSLNKLARGLYTVSVQNLANNIGVSYTPNATINLAENDTQNVSLHFNVIPVNPSSSQKIVGYFETWAASYAAIASDYSLSKMPNYINTINLAFAKPDATYTSGSLNLSGTGIEVAVTGSVLRDAINLAHAKGQVVLLSVGGATYGNFAGINIPALIAIVKDFNLDGIDLDYEVNSAGCSNINTNSLSCSSDSALIGLISNLRTALDNYRSGLKLTAAVWSIGAYGTPTFPTTVYGPYGSMSAIWVNPLKQVGNKFNELYLMSYDAGNKATTGYDPISALKAYKALTNVPVYLGIEVPPEAWGGNVMTPEQAVSLATQTRDLGGAGVMLWALHLTGTVNGVTYTANSYLQPICNLYGLGNVVCSKAIPAR